MKKKDYELIARILKNAEPSTDLALRTACSDLADAFEDDNPRFDREKFIKACGIDTPKTKTFTGLGGAVWTVPNKD